MDANRFLDDPAGFLAWAAEHWKQGPQWCPKHWAPCPVEGKNGLLATSVLMQDLLASMPDDIAAGGATVMNSWLANKTTPVCCELGDDKIAALWARC